MTAFLEFMQVLREMPVLQRLMLLLALISLISVIMFLVMFVLPAITPDPKNSNNSPAVAATAQTPEKAYIRSQRISAQSAIQHFGDVYINIYNGAQITKSNYKVVADDGGEAEIEVYLLYNAASWAYGKIDEFVDPSNRSVDLERFFSEGYFPGEAIKYDAIVCLGLASASKTSTSRNISDISDKRAVQLCGLISKQGYVKDGRPQMYGLALGYHSDTSVIKLSREERLQRGVIVLGIKSAKGSLEGVAARKRAIKEIIHSNSLAGFDLRSYSKVARQAPLQFIEVRRD